MAGFQGFHYGPGNRQIDQPDVKSIFLSWFDHQVQNSSSKEFQIKQPSLHVETSCPPADNINETTSYLEPNNNEHTCR